MNQIAQKKGHHLPDVSAFIEIIESSSELFDQGAATYFTRAPGRLDVMGGIADYSGSLVLEMPIKEAALVALQKHSSRNIKIVSLGAENNNRSHQFEMSLDDFEPNGKPISYAEAREKFRGNSATGWAAYIAGAFLVLMREKKIYFPSGASILIDSKVPEGKGVSSSAAIEVAAMKAITAAFEIEVEPRELAILCQTVENLVVGAPCGIMDQTSVACGKENQLLSMICQPAEIQESVKIPAEVAFWGIDSGIRHSVGAGDYGSVRTGAFIGYRMIADLAGFAVRETEIEGVVEIKDGNWSGFLANIAPREFDQKFAAHLPKEILGEDFLAKYKGITDRATKVSPDKIYQIFYPTAHPIYENARVHKFAKLLKEQVTEENLKELGELMYESHASYSACGLGSEGTDLLVEMVKKSEKLCGAKITGGGSGGTIAVLGRKGADSEIAKIAEDYEKQTGYRPHIFSGSSMGAAEFGYLKLIL